MDSTSALILALDLKPGDIVSWLITGALAGALVGRILKGKEGWGFFKTIILGCGGALIGFVVFGLLTIELPGLENIRITAKHLVGAIGGTLLLIPIIKAASKPKKKQA